MNDKKLGFTQDEAELIKQVLGGEEYDPAVHLAEHHRVGDCGLFDKVNRKTMHDDDPDMWVVVEKTETGCVLEKMSDGTIEEVDHDTSIMLDGILCTSMIEQFAAYAERHPDDYKDR